MSSRERKIKRLQIWAGKYSQQRAGSLLAAHTGAESAQGAGKRQPGHRSKRRISWGLYTFYSISGSH